MWECWMTIVAYFQFSNLSTYNTDDQFKLEAIFSSSSPHMTELQYKLKKKKQGKAL